MLTNAGFVYFNTKKEGDYDPRKFYPLNDFLLKDLDEKVSIILLNKYQAAKRKFAFKIIFKRQEVDKELILAANSQFEKEQWLIAIREHQRQFLEARIKIFEHKMHTIALKQAQK